MSRSRIVQIRVSPEEEARLKALAAAKGMPLSELLRRSALGRRLPAAKNPPVRVAGSDLVGMLEERIGRSFGAAELEGSNPAGGDGSSGSAAPTVPVFRCPAWSEGAPCCEARAPTVRCPVHGFRLALA